MEARRGRDSGPGTLIGEDRSLDIVMVVGSTELDGNGRRRSDGEVNRLAKRIEWKTEELGRTRRPSHK